jgi:hypothetical protein
LLQKAIKGGIRDLTRDDPSVTQQALGLKVKTFQELDRSVIARVNIRFQADQTQILKGIIYQSGQSFLHIAITPKVAAQGIGYLCASAIWLKVKEVTSP